MHAIAEKFPPKVREALFRLDSPLKVQQWLDTLKYPAGEHARSPIEVFEDKKASCMDGALVAFVALFVHGFGPRLIDLLPSRDEQGKPLDDDHVIVAFRQDGLWGAVAMSNTTTLRSREPLHKNVHELVLSYFEFYLNDAGDKTLRLYSDPYDPAQEFGTAWMHTKRFPRRIEARLDALRHHRILPQGYSPWPQSKRVTAATMFAGNPAGFFRKGR